MSSICTATTHAVNNNRIKPPFPAGYETIALGMGCFWGAEKLFWQMKGVYSTACGYAGGHKEDPTYADVCSHKTGHAEVVLVVYDPSTLSTQQVLEAFWEGHAPNQGDRQNVDVGNNYRSVIYTTTEEQLQLALKSKEIYQKRLTDSGIVEPITTEIKPLDKFFYAEDYHQQYFHKNPRAQCTLRGSGVCYRSP